MKTPLRVRRGARVLPGQGGGPPNCLLALPEDLLVAELVSLIQGHGKRCFRALSASARALINNTTFQLRLEGGHLNPATACQLRQQFPNLKQLVICDGMGGSGRGPVQDGALGDFLCELGPSASALTHLQLKHAYYLTHSSMDTVASACTGLVSLSLSRWVDRQSLLVLCKLPSLLHLDLGDTDMDVYSVVGKKCNHAFICSPRPRPQHAHSVRELGLSLSMACTRCCICVVSCRAHSLSSYHYLPPPPPHTPLGGGGGRRPTGTFGGGGGGRGIGGGEAGGPLGGNLEVFGGWGAEAGLEVSFAG